MSLNYVCEITETTDYVCEILKNTQGYSFLRTITFALNSLYKINDKFIIIVT